MRKNEPFTFISAALISAAAVLPFFALVFTLNKPVMVAEIMAYILGTFLIAFIAEKGNFMRNPDDVFDIRYPEADMLICFYLSVRFYQRWYAYSIGRGLFESAPISPQQIFVITAAVLFAAAVPSVDLVFKVAGFAFRKDYQHKTDGLFPYFFIFLTAFTIISLNSECSPLYPTNNWNDTNIMFTVGKSVLKGFVPYRDYLDQKGPLCLFLHTIGAAVSYDTFIGMWILEIAAAFLFLLNAYRTLKLYAGHEVLWYIPLIAALTYVCGAFETGDSAEEYCLPLISYAFYTAFKSIKSEKLPIRKEFFLIGLTSGCVFWIKYSMLGFYAAWFIFFLIFSRKRGTVRELFTGCAIIAAGVITISVPVIAFFAVNSALGDLFNGYFYNIIVYYADDSFSFPRKMFEGFLIFIKTNPLSVILPAAVVILLQRQKKYGEACFTAFVFIVDFIFTYSGGRFISYYSFIFCVFLTAFFCGIVIQQQKNDFCRHFISSRAVFSAVLAFSAGVTLLSAFSTNMKHIGEDKNNFVAFKLKNMIDVFGVPDPKVLHYKTMETGLNTVAGLLPNVKHFCSYNMDELKEQFIEQEACIASGCADFIIMDADHILAETDIPDFDHYSYIDFIEGNTRTTPGTFFYHVWRKKSL